MSRMSQKTLKTASGYIELAIQARVKLESSDAVGYQTLALLSPAENSRPLKRSSTALSDVVEEQYHEQGTLMRFSC
jgi:hypothetical protein